MVEPTAVRTQVSRRHILFVDDDRPNQVIFRHAFGASYKVTAVSSGAEALEVLGREPVTVLVTDQRMPGMTGVELCEEVRDRFPEMPRLLVTGFSDQETAVQAINRGGVSSYFVKPMDLALIRRTLEGLIARVELERELKAVRSALLDRERDLMEAAILQEVTHDINNANTIVMTCCSGLEDVLRDGGRHIPEPVLRLLESEVEELRAAVELLAALRARSRQAVPAGRAAGQPVLVREALRPVAAMVRAQGFYGIRLRLHLPDGLEVMADSVDLSRILVNLCINAMEALSTQTGDGRRVDVEVRQEGEVVCFDVRDNGPGVPPALRDSIFERNRSGHGHHKGRGLGLFICRELAVANGGAVTLAESSSEGSVFRLTLPAVEPGGDG